MKRLTFSLLLISVILPIASAQTNSEPNAIIPGLIFKVRNLPITWTVSDNSEKKLFHNPDVNRPPYVVELWLHGESHASIRKDDVLRKIRKSPLSQELSKRQQKFLDTGYAVWVDRKVTQLPDKIQPKPDFFPTWLYAFSKTDAQNMVRVYLDQLNREVAEKIVSCGRTSAAQAQKVQEAQKKLPKKREEMAASEKTLQQLKKLRHEFDSDPVQNAKETIREMRDVLDKLEIELTGVREKLNSIDELRKETGKRPLSPQVQIKLDEMYIELMIELSGLEARKAITEHIQGQEGRFLDFHIRREKLVATIRYLNKTIQQGQDRIIAIKQAIENPTYDTCPPKVYKNTVLIHRISGSSAPEDVQAYIRKTEAFLLEDHLAPQLHTGPGNASQARMREAILRNQVKSGLNEVEGYLSKIASGYLQVEPHIVENLKEIQQQIRVLETKLWTASKPME